MPARAKAQQRRLQLAVRFAGFVALALMVYLACQNATASVESAFKLQGLVVDFLPVAIFLALAAYEVSMPHALDRSSLEVAPNIVEASGQWEAQAKIWESGNGSHHRPSQIKTEPVAEPAEEQAVQQAAQLDQAPALTSELPGRAEAEESTQASCRICKSYVQYCCS